MTPKGCSYVQDGIYHCDLEICYHNMIQNLMKHNSYCFFQKKSPIIYKINSERIPFS